MSRNEVPYVRFKGVKISNVGYKDAYAIIKAKTNEKGYICLNDTRNIITATKDQTLYDAINASLLSIADGTPLAWYGRLLGSKSIERIAGFDLMTKMFENNDGLKHYLLGDTEQTIAKVIKKAKKANGNLQITGDSPPFREQFTEEENEEIFKKINKVNPDIIWVCFGGKKQEKWMYHNLKRLNRGVMAGVGAAFKFYIGDLFIPPKIIQRMGMQYFFRWLDISREKILTSLRVRIEFLFYFPFEIIKTLYTSTKIF